MMIAYHDGSLFETITEALKSNESIMNSFKSKLQIEQYPDKNIKSLLDALLRKFKNIRGRWFVNNVRGQVAHKTKFSTRDNVSVKKEIAQATADTKLEIVEKQMQQSLYETAEKNIDNVDYDSADELDS